MTVGFVIVLMFKSRDFTGDLVIDSELSPKSPPTRRVPPRGTPRVPAPLPLSPFSPPDRDRRGDSPASLLTQ